MNQHRHTKDERFLLEALSRTDEKAEEPTRIDRYVLGDFLGISSHVVDQIVQGLARANLIKKVGDRDFFLTERGAAAAREIREM